MFFLVPRRHRWVGLGFNNDAMDLLICNIRYKKLKSFSFQNCLEHIDAEHMFAFLEALRPEAAASLESFEIINFVRGDQEQMAAHWGLFLDIAMQTFTNLKRFSISNLIIQLNIEYLQSMIRRLPNVSLFILDCILPRPTPCDAEFLKIKDALLNMQSKNYIQIIDLHRNIDPPFFNQLYGHIHLHFHVLKHIPSYMFFPPYDDASSASALIVLDHDDDDDDDADY